MKKLCIISGFIVGLFSHSPASNPESDVLDLIQRPSGSALNGHPGSPVVQRKKQ